MKIGIVGWGVEGQSAYRYFGPSHSYLIVNEHPRDDFPQESESVRVQALAEDKPVGLTGNATDLSYLAGIDGCDKIVYSVTSYKNLQQRFGDDKSFWDKATTAQHIFFEMVKTKNIIGVTGTKGKGTTSTLIAKMLEAAGKKVHLGGNIGRSVLDIVVDVEPDDWVVLELANFQLHKFPYSPHIAICLMIAQEHMDWHPDMDEYLEAKANIFKHQSPDDIAIYFPDNQYSIKIANYSKGKKLPYYQKPGAYVRDDGLIVIGEDETEVMPKSEVKLLGEHNLQNICAALTAFWEVSSNLDAAKQVLSSFSGLEHRLEFVRTLDGVKYYNDSFAATPDAGTAAIGAIPGPKVMIMGGFDRHLPLERFVEEIKAHSDDIRKIVLIGQSAQRVAEGLKQAGYDNFIVSSEKIMSAILSQTQEYTQPGDAVILSPGFPSFDMFKNFEVRGKEFKAAVKKL